MEEIILFNFDKKDDRLEIHLNPKSERRLLPSVLEDPAIENLPFSGKKILLEGRAPLWMYAHFAVRAAMKGAEELSLSQPHAGNTLIWRRGPLLSAASDTGNPCFTITKSHDEVHLVFNTAPDEKAGKWTMDDLIKTPLRFPADTETLIIGGNAAIWMYAAVAVAAHAAGIKHILYNTPIEKTYISIGALEPGKRVNRKRSGNGLVIGIVGDPNSGKSVFRDWLERILKDEWPNSWGIDADFNAPTPNWFLNGLSSELAEEVEKIRKDIKKDWTHELELMVADRLRNTRENLDITLVDLPGGNHKDKQNPLRIPPGRDVIYKEIDRFIVLWRDKAILEGWLSALREHNMDNLVFVEIESREPKSPPSLETHMEGGMIIGTARGLDRGNTGYSVKRSVKQGAAEIVRRISELMEIT